MKSITLVCTVHKEKGAANVSNLYKILEHIQPEVIFLEVSPDDFDSYYITCNLEKLEPKAVIQYKANRHIDLVPVDISITDKNIYMKAQRLFGMIDLHSTTHYQQKYEHIQTCVFKSGFSYLNSDQYSKDQAELNEEDFEIIRKIDDPEIIGLYEWWNTTISHRENEMINRIYEYSRDNTFQRTVFLIGAAHRHSIIKKGKELNNNDPGNIEWHYYS